ncbi:MAG: DoxX family membrane protein [Candidatus Sericytochromatia bacterium]|uniref:DoxX family membrane protein n=1 Tax=Candidatus Tanganyikabacteria bacterium TaxID=2961651 RepID=A0A937X5H1_9BACT|nr:DoxX family membrane protein [Candidatus Tanganyikabacteria bacterium]
MPARVAVIHVILLPWLTSSRSVGGVLLAVGRFEPPAAAVMVSVMVLAIVTVHWRNGLLAFTNGIELPFFTST